MRGPVTPRNYALALRIQAACYKKSFFYDDARIHGRSKIIQLAIDARKQSYPDETPYVYHPMMQAADSLRWSQQTRDTVLKNYNQMDLGI